MSKIDWQSNINRAITHSTQGTDPEVTLINDQSVLEIKGPDAEKFLQGQCSADIAALSAGLAAPGCICTVKGRVLCTFVATRVDDRILLRMSTELIASMRKYLAKYAAFFKVELIEWRTPSVLERHGSAALKTPFIALNYHLNETAFTECLVAPENLPAMLEELNGSELNLVSGQTWTAKQIRAGWLNLRVNTTEKYLPHQLNLERLGAISFTKGCYTGQEIIARTEYRGKPKRRMHLIELEVSDKAALVSLDLPSDILEESSDKAQGILLEICGDQQKALAILPIDSPARIKGRINRFDAVITIAKQPYPPES